MTLSQMSILRSVLTSALNLYFSSDLQRMSSSIGCTQADLSTALNKDGARKSADVFEKLSSYCIENNLCIDVLLKKFEQK